MLLPRASRSPGCSPRRKRPRAWPPPASRSSHEPLPALLDIESAIAARSFHTEPLVIRRGESEQAIAGAPHHIEGESHGRRPGALLPRDPGVDRVPSTRPARWSSTRRPSIPSETQEIVARVLGLPKSAVVCESLRMGGAFGGKEVQANAWAAVAALGATLTGRPVRVRLDRAARHGAHRQAPSLPRPLPCRLSTTRARLLGMELELFTDGGWSLDLSEPVMYRRHVPLRQRLRRARRSRSIGRVCRTHKTSQTAFRGFGGPQGMLVIEEVMDRIARHLGMTPHAVRRTNLYREGRHDALRPDDGRRGARPSSSGTISARRAISKRAAPRSNASMPGART